MVIHFMEFVRLEIVLLPKGTSTLTEHIRISKKVEMVVFGQYHGLVEEIAETLKLSVKDIEEQGVRVQGLEVSGKGSSRIVISEAERELGRSRWVIVYAHGIFSYFLYPRCEAELIGSCVPQTIIKAESSGE